MNPLMKAVLGAVKKISVVHSIPGRLRINVFGIKQYPDMAKSYAPALEKALLSISGVKSADICFATGNVLIAYDFKKISDSEILARLNARWNEVCELALSAASGKVQDDSVLQDKIEKIISKI